MKKYINKGKGISSEAILIDQGTKNSSALSKPQVLQKKLKNFSYKQMAESNKPPFTSC